jgi:hypothetical protein
MAKLAVLEAIDELGQLALQVSGFVFVELIILAQAVNHTHNFGEEFLSVPLVFHRPQVLDGRTGAFLIVAVVQAALSRLADAFLS